MWLVKEYFGMPQSMGPVRITITRVLASVCSPPIPIWSQHLPRPFHSPPCLVWWLPGQSRIYGPITMAPPPTQPQFAPSGLSLSSETHIPHVTQNIRKLIVCYSETFFKDWPEIWTTLWLISLFWFYVFTVMHCPVRKRDLDVRARRIIILKAFGFQCGPANKIDGFQYCASVFLYRPLAKG